MGETSPAMEALGRVASGLYIVTAESGDSRAAFLASWVAQAGFSPPAISVAIKQDRAIMRMMGRDARFALNILGSEDKALMGQFAKGFPLDADPFEGADIRRTERGTPYLGNALGYLECRLLRLLEPSTDHNLVVGEVIGGAMLKEGEPWTHVRKSGEKY